VAGQAATSLSGGPGGLRWLPPYNTLDLRALLAGMPESRDSPLREGREFVNGWGIFALPFASGDVLALRVFPQNDFGPYVAVWHRDPGGRWAIYVDGARLDTACPRYFSPACEYTGLTTITVAWTGPDSLHIQMSDPALDWTLTARSTPVLAFFNAVSARLPAASWRPRALVRAREIIAAWLGLGQIQLAGVMPSGHAGQLMPDQMYFVDQSAARLRGRDLGRPVRLPASPLIGNFRLPCRGVLVKGGASWEIRDPAEYARTRAETG
jgi:hypothetical protein